MRITSFERVHPSRFISQYKLWNTFHKPKDVAHACELSLKNLRVDVIGELSMISKLSYLFPVSIVDQVLTGSSDKR